MGDFNLAKPGCFGVNDFAGLCEVQFEGVITVPAPSSLLLAVIALLRLIAHGPSCPAPS